MLEIELKAIFACDLFLFLISNIAIEVNQSPIDFTITLKRTQTLNERENNEVERENYSKSIECFVTFTLSFNLNRFVVAVFIVANCHFSKVISFQPEIILWKQNRNGLVSMVFHFFFVFLVLELN